MNENRQKNGSIIRGIGVSCRDNLGESLAT